MLWVEQSARNAYNNSHDPDNPDALPGSDKWSQRKTVIASAVFCLQYGGSWTIRRRRQITASGSIDSKFGALTHGSSGTTTTAHAPIAPAITEQYAQTQARAIAARDALVGLRLALDQHDLTAARGRLKIATAQQRARPEFDAMKDELVKHELQRDAALQLARACERTSAWSCVQQNAVETLDIGNTKSQTMLEKVIEHAGWASNSTAAAAKKALTTPPVPNSAKQNGAAQASAVAAQTNVVTVTPSGKAPATSAQRGADRRAAHSATDSRQLGADDAHADNDSVSRNERLTCAQAATNALTAATVGAPSMAGMPTPGTQGTPSVAATTPTIPQATTAPTTTTTTTPPLNAVTHT